MDAAFSRLETRFNSKQHQAQALNYLKRLTFAGIKSEKGCSDIEVLNEAHARILEYNPQCGPSFQGCHQDGHMSTIMAEIVDSEDWAEVVLASRITSDGTRNSLDYHSFYSILTSALTLCENRQ